MSVANDLQRLARDALMGERGSDFITAGIDDDHQSLPALLTLVDHGIGDRRVAQQLPIAVIAYRGIVAAQFKQRPSELQQRILVLFLFLDSDGATFGIDGQIELPWVTCGKTCIPTVAPLHWGAGTGAMT